MSHTLKTIDDWNAERPHRRGIEPLTGIACPKCGAELRDTGNMLLSNPPQIQVSCPSCGWQGVRAE